MVASVPDDTNRIDSRPAIRSTTISAMTTSASVGAPKLVPREAATEMASRIAGWAWPRIPGP